MALTGKKDHFVTLEEAKNYINNHRTKNGIAADDNQTIRGGFIGREAMLKLLNQDGCIGFKYYFGADENDVANLVIVGVSSDEKDMTDGLLIQKIDPCPPNCDLSSELMK